MNKPTNVLTSRPRKEHFDKKRQTLTRKGFKILNKQGKGVNKRKKGRKKGRKEERKKR